MSRWKIEKSGTGIEKSGTGIEKSGTGIEKSGTGIEKSGTGIEKSGTGIRKGFLACSIVALTFASQLSAAEIRPEGLMQVTVDQGQVSVMWNIDGNTFVGKGSQVGTFTQLSLFEISVSNNTSTEIAGGGTGTQIAGGGTGSMTQIAGGGTGSKTQIAGGGTGSAIEIAGGGTGSAIEIAGGGTGSAIQIAGGGTGSAIQIAGGGTGSAIQIAGGGTGSAIQIAGGGTGSEIQIAGGGTGTTIQIAGGGTGKESVFITLPDGTGLEMEVTLSCNTASVSVLDSNYTEVVSFNNISVMGDTGLCQASGQSRFGSNQGRFDSGLGTKLHR